MSSCFEAKCMFNGSKTTLTITSNTHNSHFTFKSGNPPDFKCRMYFDVSTERNQTIQIVDLYIAWVIKKCLVVWNFTCFILSLIYDTCFQPVKWTGIRSICETMGL